MLLLFAALACTKGEEATDDPFRGLATFTVEGGAAVSEDVELEWIGHSEVDGDGFSVLTMADDEFVWELMFVLEGAASPGTTTPLRARYRKGQQALVDAEATCSVTLEESTSGSARFEGSFSCEGLHTEEGLAAGDEAPWSITGGAFSGGTDTRLAQRAERLAGDGYTYAVELSREGATVSQDDPTRAYAVPWRGEETWIIFEDGLDDSLDDLTLRLIPDGTSLLVRRWTRQDLAESTAIDLHFVAEEPGITAGIEGGEALGEGMDFRLRLWDDAREGQDDLTVNIQ